MIIIIPISPRYRLRVRRVRSGICQICGCTDERGCATGCWWADRSAHHLLALCQEYDGGRAGPTESEAGMSDELTFNQKCMAYGDFELLAQPRRRKRGTS